MLPLCIGRQGCLLTCELALPSLIHDCQTEVGLPDTTRQRLNVSCGLRDWHAATCELAHGLWAGQQHVASCTHCRAANCVTRCPLPCEDISTVPARRTYSRKWHAAAGEVGNGTHLQVWAILQQGSLHTADCMA